MSKTNKQKTLSHIAVVAQKIQLCESNASLNSMGFKQKHHPTLWQGMLLFCCVHSAGAGLGQGVDPEVPPGSVQFLYQQDISEQPQVPQMFHKLHAVRAVCT